MVVIGGGPAGCMAASCLAKAGFSTVLLEKARHPRPNVGESLIPHFWKYTDLMGVSKAIEEDGFVKKGGGLALWRGTMRQLRFSDFGYDRPALHAERDRFDHLLLQQTRANGAQVFEETTVTGLDADLNAPVVRYQTKGSADGHVRAAYVVDASGQSAVLALQLGIREYDPDIRFLSLWGYYKGGRYVDIDGEVHPFASRHEHRPATFTSSIDDWGWVWHIVMRDKVSVGVILSPERLKAFKAVRDTPEAKFQGLVAEAPVVGDLLREAEFEGEMYGIKDYAYKPVQLAVGNCYLAGDAAAFVDPINSAGVVFGMYAGFASAWSIAESFRNRSRSDDYRRRYCKLYGDRLALFRLLALPPDAKGVDQAIEEAGDVVTMTSTTELQLMLLTTIQNIRSEGITKVLDRYGLTNTVEFRTIAVPKVA